MSFPPVTAALFPEELTALRAGGLVLAAGLAIFAIARRRSLRNGDVLILLGLAVGLALVAGTELLDTILSAFSFERENGTRIVGVAVFAILILFALVVRALAQGSRVTRELQGVLEGLAWERFRRDGHHQKFRGKIAILVPAYNERENIGQVLEGLPREVCGRETAVLVVDDGSRDGTGDVAERAG